jgi:hypothetical protein
MNVDLSSIMVPTKEAADYEVDNIAQDDFAPEPPERNERNECNEKANPEPAETTKAQTDAD